MQIREFMTQSVVTVREDTTLEEVARTMLEHHIGGVPVVNTQGKLSSIITVSDFAAKARGIPFSTFRAPQVFGHWLGGEPLEQIYAMARQMTVRDIDELSRHHGTRRTVRRRSRGTVPAPRYSPDSSCPRRRTGRYGIAT